MFCRGNREAINPALKRIALILSLGILLLGGCGDSPPSAPLVLLISFDTLRADAIGVQLGGENSLTPNLDRFAADAVVFEKAFAQIPHTLPSHMSMWTGVYPDVHGVTHDKEQPLPESFNTLPELFKAAGYRAAAVVTSEWLKQDFGFARGFDSYEVLPHKITYSDRVYAAAELQLESIQKGEPLFLFLHNYEAHCDFGAGGRNKLPYYSPPSFRVGLASSSDGAEYCGDDGRCAAEFLMYSGERQFSPSTLKNIRELYLAGVNHLDQEVGKLFAFLRARGLYDDAFIVVTSDHGEEFREHGRFIHSQPYDETISVPLMLKFPGSRKAGMRIERLVESIDILPTFAEYLRVEAGNYVQGESLLPLIDHGQFAKTAIASQDTIKKSRYALRTESRKYVLDLAKSIRELYDLEYDPQERINILGDRPEEAEDLEKILVTLILSNRDLGARMTEGYIGDENETILTEQERKNLESLGYLQ
jgi:hypothetical protein